MQQNNHHSQCILLALCVCALGRGLPEKVLGLAQRRGGVGSPPPPSEGGGGPPPPPPTAPQTVEHPSGSHIGWRQPPWTMCRRMFGPLLMTQALPHEMIVMNDEDVCALSQTHHLSLWAVQ